MTTTVHSPTAGRRRVRNVLRRAREAADLTQDKVAEAMDWSLSKVIRIETGGVGISTSDLRQLLQLYQVNDPAEVTALVELARIGRQRPWWTSYRDVLPAGYLSYIGLEDESSALRTVNPVGMPGLLQTEEFSRALAAAGQWTTTVDGTPLSPSLAADHAEVRMIRQREVLRRSNPPEITAVLDEAVLRRQVGGPKVLRRQLLHLVALGSKPLIKLHVLPFTASISIAVSPFVIVEFPEPADTDVFYTESAFEYRVIDDPTDLQAHRGVFEHLSGVSLPEEESLAMIARVAGEIA